MKAIEIRTVGDLYNLIKTCQALQTEVDEKEKEYQDCNYDPCGYMQGRVLDAQEGLDDFLEQLLIFKE